MTKSLIVKPTFDPLLCAPIFFVLVLSQIRQDLCIKFVIQIFVLLLREFLRFENIRGLRMSKQQNSNLFAAAAGLTPLYTPAFCGFPGNFG
jgi:hypothetical protein